MLATTLLETFLPVGLGPADRLMTSAYWSLHRIAQSVRQRTEASASEGVGRKFKPSHISVCTHKSLDHFEALRQKGGSPGDGIWAASQADVAEEHAELDGDSATASVRP
jgi:hypothetical protein